MMSKFFNTDHSKVTVGIAIGVGVAAVTAGYFYKRWVENSPPSRWVRVGELSDLVVYPIKSCGPVRTNELECSVLGLAKGHLRDRVFMIITPEGQFITARARPKCLQIQPRFEGDRMILSAPGMLDIEVDMKRLYETKPIRAVVWGETVDAVDCGEEVARWISRFLVSEDIGMRLVFYPATFPTRSVREKNRGFPDLTEVDSGALHDATSFMLMNESSVAELNSRLKDPVSHMQFRPNFMVKGPIEAFVEDNWKWIRIGNHAVFRNVKLCGRCILTNINPESALRNPDGQPLKTLKEYRMVPGAGESPILGIHLGVRETGKVSIGDTVYVGEK
ncbi:mitochondrial amidoxime reducing component 2-like [Phlebotomus argentipes]|uniref:mitochondrial amidoxime reducing component 2-like n=1 Tax=Phlebotomus argentipes TaxID=94469 RepID=UPI00289371A0|nr:mitochondrial amidoxime reducing component 2-like [Phlebotomus argentipes]